VTELVGVTVELVVGWMLDEDGEDEDAVVWMDVERLGVVDNADVLWVEDDDDDGMLVDDEKTIVDLLPSICVISVVVKIGSVKEVDEITVVTKEVKVDVVVANDVDGTGLLVDGDGDWTEVVTGLYVLTLVDVDTLELALLEVNTELEEGVDTEVLTYGVLLVAWLDELVIDVDGAGLLVDGDGDWTEVVTGLYVLTLVDVDTLELALLEVNAELDEGVDTEELTYGLDVLTT